MRARFFFRFLTAVITSGFVLGVSLAIPTGSASAAWVCERCACDCGGSTLSAPWPSGATARTDPQAVCVGQCQTLPECGGAVTRDQARGISCREIPDDPAKTDSSAAPTPRTPEEFGYENPLRTTDFNVVIGRIIRTVLGFVGALFLAMFVYGGTVWMLAGGDAKKVETGRKALINAVIGMVVIALSYSILAIVFETARVVRGG